MLSPLLASSKDVELWAEHLDARATLPRLVRRLVLATLERVEFVSFRADEGVQVGGYDGIVQASQGNAFVPDGLSVWELSTERNVKRKADEDYAKRSATPGSVDPASTSFVFVTARRWKGKENWAIEKQQKGFWKTVRAYDADDLTVWLEQAPAVHFWFSLLIGKHPTGAKDLRSFWEEWSACTRPQLSSDLVISGRGEAVSKIQQWLRGEPSALGLRADTRHEAVAFFIASVLQMPKEEQERVLARGVVVEDPATWQQLVLWDNPLVLIPVFPERSQVGQAVSKGHHVLVPLDQSEPHTGEALFLPRLRRMEAKKALVAMGFDEAQAEDLAALAHQSLEALRRKLAIHPATLTPEWARPGVARSLLPVLLAGRWDDQNAADREAVARLAGQEYGEVRKLVLRWANEPDPPVRLVGNIWMVTAREDRWLLLCSYLTDEEFRRFEAVAIDVLGELDPKFELPHGERWLAKIYGKTPKHSDHLREGLAETLVLMAAYGGHCRLTAATAQEWSDRVVAGLLSQASDWRLWASLSPVLPLLAEAAPRCFLDAVGRDLALPNPNLVNLFTDTEYHFMESSPHVGLLWALEVLAWSPEYLSSAALSLAKLARLDPGGKLANRPINSLRRIFLSWYPCTTATLEQRLKVLDAIRRWEPQVAWELLLALLPRFSDATHPTAKPKWRNWASEHEPRVTYGEINKAAAEVAQRLLEDVGTDGTRWRSVIEVLDQFPEAEFDAAVDRLLALCPKDLPQDERLQIWEALRGLLSRHIEFPGAKWALPRAAIERLKQCYTRFEPEDPLLKITWLFSNHPDFLEEGLQDWHEREQAIEQGRIRAVEELFELRGLSGILELASQAKAPWTVGRALGQSKALYGQEEEFLSQGLGSTNQALRQAALNFLDTRASIRGQEWLESLRSSKTWEEWDPRQRADYYLCLPFSGRTWDILETEEVQTQHLYWSKVGIFGGGNLETDSIVRATRKFVEHGCLEKAVEFLALHRGKLRSQPRLAAEVLEFAVQEKHTEGVDWASLSHELGELLDILRASGEIEEVRLARLEWYFLPLILQSYHHQPKTLHRALAEDPEFFVEVLKWIYPVEGESASELTEKQRARTRLALKLLRSWRCPPGVDKDGAVNAEKLRSWVNRARELAYASDRGKWGDQEIGRILAHYPLGSDGAWPHEALRDLLEELVAEGVEKGIIIGLCESQGIRVKSSGEGGTHERAIAEKYRSYARIVGEQWPRTALLLEKVARAYEADARREDIRAQLEEDLWG